MGMIGRRGRGSIKERFGLRQNYKSTSSEYVRPFDTLFCGVSKHFTSSAQLLELLRHSKHGYVTSDMICWRNMRIGDIKNNKWIQKDIASQVKGLE